MLAVGTTSDAANARAAEDLLDLTTSYLSYLAVAALLVITPGSTTAVVVRNTLGGGRRAGLRAAFGAAAANSTHATLAGLGLWVAVGRWPVVLDAVRLAGAAYLGWLGLSSLWRAWRADAWPVADSALSRGGASAGVVPVSAPSSGAASPAVAAPGVARSHDFSPSLPVRPGDERDGDAAFREGLAVNLLNPAIIGFYLAVVPTFVPPFMPTGAARGYFAVLAATHVLLALACHTTWATAFHSLRGLFVHTRLRQLLDILTGVALVWLAIRVAG